MSDIYKEVQYFVQKEFDRVRAISNPMIQSKILDEEELKQEQQDD